MSDHVVIQNSQDHTPGLHWRQIGWWSLFLVCGFFSIYAFYIAGLDILFRLGVITDVKDRAVPVVFIIHALSGGVALLTGALQLNQAILANHRALHRVLGRFYVFSVWISSLGGLWLTFFFDVNMASKIVFTVLALLWFGTTTHAFVSIRRQNIAGHRVWMLRSFALTFFFVTFSFWVDGLAGTGIPAAVAYPLAVFMSWSVNILVAELWLRKTDGIIKNRG